MRFLLPLAGGDGAQEKRRRITVEVEVHEPASGFNVLKAEIFKERTLAGPRFSEKRDVHGAPRWAQSYAPPRCLFIRDLEPERDSAAGFLPCLSPPLQAVPNRTHELFEEANHAVSMCGGLAKTVTTFRAARRESYRIQQVASGNTRET